MDKKWVESKNKEYTRKIEDAKAKIATFINSLGLNEKVKKEVLYCLGHYGGVIIAGMTIGNELGISIKDVQELFKKNDIEKLSEILEYSDSYKIVGGVYQRFNRFLDSKIVEFDGDVLITDPCYIMKGNDWQETNYGSNLEAVGIKTYVTNDTIYGDWSCTVYDKNKLIVGEFCADAGLVSIISLDEANVYNKADVDDLLKKDWCATVIKDFKGTGQVVVREIEYEYEGKKETDYEAYVELIGIDKNTGEHVRFFSAQTGL